MDWRNVLPFISFVVAMINSTFESSCFEMNLSADISAKVHPPMKKTRTTFVELLLLSGFPFRYSKFLSETNPKYFGWLYTHYEETFLVLNGLLQYYYIRKYDASFSEYFYGLRRISADGKLLSAKQRNLSLTFLVLLPYIKRKLEEKLALYKIQDAEGYLKNDLQSHVKRLLINIQSAFEFSWGLWVLVNYLRYMSDATIYQRPTLQLLKMQLVLAEDDEDVSSFWGALLKRKLSLKEFGTGLLKHGLRTSLELGAFFIQFLQVWYAEKSNYSITALPTVPPPEPDPKAKTYSGRCPICLQPWRIPTVLPASGYVYCFPCIVRHLREDPRCPVTNVPSRPLDIVRLYDS